VDVVDKVDALKPAFEPVVEPAPVLAPAKTRAAWWLKERTAIAFLVAIVLSIPIGFLRENDDRGIPAPTYWATKMDWRRCADVVLAGDSRIYMGLLPSEMKKDLPDTRILNFAFDALGYSEKYLRATERVLDPGSPRKTIVLGITPRSLTRGTRERNMFLYVAAIPGGRRKLSRVFGQLQFLTRPMNVEEIKGLIKNERDRGQHFREYHADGAMLPRREPDDPTAEIRLYVQLFDPKQEGPVVPEATEDIMKYVAKWRREGIEVLGFRPPSTPAMVALEADMAHFDEADFVRRFKEAGGRWLEVKPFAYLTYDGSHLAPEGAVEFSRDFALLLK
jgi:hypothetical protein